MIGYFLRKSRRRVVCSRLSLFGALICMIASSVSAQKSISPADTGRIKWGHSDFNGYDRAGMCNRTLDEVDRQHTRIYVKDTAFEPIRNNKSYVPKVSQAVVETVKRCIEHLDMNAQPANQLWVISRIYMGIGELQKSKDVAEKAISTGVNHGEQLEMMIEAMEMYLNFNGGSLEHVHYFANRIRSEDPVSKVAKFKADFLIGTYYYIQYEPDSVLAYTNSAIEILSQMTLEEMDSVPAIEPFSLQINIANVNGDLSTQEKVAERAQGIVAHWRNGMGARFVTGFFSGIEAKKTAYNKRTSTLEGGIWENFDGTPRPLTGKPSIFIAVNHNCKSFCYNQLSSIKRLKNTFGDSLDLVLITSTMGYVPGSGPLTPKEEAKLAGKFLREVHDLPYTLFVDESPSYKLDDGRIIREKSPVMQMLSDIGNASAIVTDSEGRVQWIGDMRNEWHLRVVTAVIDRALNSMSK